jgi:hypothetical protein
MAADADTLQRVVDELDIRNLLARIHNTIDAMRRGEATAEDYNANWTGPTSPQNMWMHSSSPCNIRSWGRNQWHHLQLSYSRTEWGVVTYHSAIVDGHTETINAAAPSAYALGWAPVLLTNVQVDGLGSSGSVTLFFDELTVYRW